MKLVYRYLDPAPSLAPPALLRFDTGVVALAALGVIVATVITTAVVEWDASRFSLPELLRHGD